MADFETGAELSLTVPGRELSAVRAQIENELSDIPIGVDASGVGGVGGGRQPRDPATGQFMSIEGVEQRIIEQTESQLDVLGDIRGVSEEAAEATKTDLAMLEVQRRTLAWQKLSAQEDVRAGDLMETQIEILDDIKDAVEGGIGGGGGGGSATTLGGLARGLGAGVGGGIGLSALGIGAGIGVAGLGVGAGVGAARGEFAQEEFVIETGNIAVNPDIEGPFIDRFEPDLNPEFALSFEPRFEPEFNPEFRPTFAPEFAPEFSPELNPTFNLSPEITSDIDFRSNITIAPEVNITGIDLGGLATEIRQVVLDSREFQNEVQNAAEDAASGLERRIIRELG